MTEAPVQPRGAPASTSGPTVGEVARKTLVVLAVVGVFALAYRFSAVLFILFSAMVLGTAVRPGLECLHRRGLTRHVSAVVLYAALLGAFALAAFVVVPVASRQASAIALDAPRYVARVRKDLERSPSPTVRRMALAIPTAPAGRPSTLAPDAPRATDALGDLSRMSAYFFQFIAVLLLGFHWSYGGDVTVRALLLLAPIERRDTVRELVDAAEAKVGGYVRGQLVVSAVTTCLSLVAFLLIGLPNALVLALVAGAMGAVPVVGGVLAAGVALLAAASEPRLVPWVLGAAVVIHVLQEYVVAPRVLGKHVGVHPFTILLAISGFGSLLGVAGAVLAIPMAAILQLLLDRFVFDTSREYRPAPAPTTERGRRAVVSLEARNLALGMRRQARATTEGADARADEVKAMVESIANDVDRLLTATPAEPTVAT